MHCLVWLYAITLLSICRFYIPSFEFIFYFFDVANSYLYMVCVPSCLLFQRTRNLFIPCAYFRWIFVGSCHCVVFFPIHFVNFHVCFCLFHSLSLSLPVFANIIPIFCVCVCVCSCDVWTPVCTFSLGEHRIFFVCFRLHSDVDIFKMTHLFDVCVLYQLNDVFFLLLLLSSRSFYFPLLKISYSLYLCIRIDV